MAAAATGTWDIVALVVYFVLVMVAGLLPLLRKNRGTISGYFLAGRFMTWLPVGASIFASNIGSEHFIGLAGSGAADGIAVGAFELNALLILQLLGWVFLPVYIASGVHTLPEYMSRRLGGSRIRVYLACISLLLYIFTKISVNMYSGALFVQEALGWNFYYAVILVLAMTAICTISGGLASVIYTDTLQTVVMLSGAVTLAVFSFSKVGGYSGLYNKYMTAVANGTDLNGSCGVPSNNSFTMLRGPLDEGYPWPGFIFGQTCASVWYWAADQMMVQRALASKSLSHAQGATIFAGYLKVLPLFLMVMPGMISRIEYPDTIACVTDCYERCGNAKSCTNLAYPKLVVHLLPEGARGLMLAVMISALMSDLTSIFNSASTLFTIDIWHRIRKNASSRELLLVGRLWIVVMVVVSLLWVPIITRQQGAQLYIYIQAVAADLSPPIAAVFLLAILWKRTNEKGAFTGLVCGFIVGVIRMILDFVFEAPGCGEPDTRPLVVSQVQYMYFAMILFWLTFLVTVIVSLLTKPPEDFRLIRMTFWTRKDPTIRRDESLPEAEMYKVGSINEHEMTPVPKEEHYIKSKEQMEEEESTCASAKHAAMRGYNWFCGYNTTPQGQEELQKFEDHLQKITTLQQATWAKVVLNINLVIVLTVGVALLVFFSVVTPVSKHLIY